MMSTKSFMDNEFLYIPIPKEYYTEVITLIRKLEKPVYKPVNPKYDYTEEELARAKELRAQGYTLRAIAKEMDWSLGAVYRRLKKI